MARGRRGVGPRLAWGRVGDKAAPVRAQARVARATARAAIHLAAAVGTRCVGVYSSRNIPGLWHPYGGSHRVLRTAIDCEGCALSVCIERGMECILSIRTKDVVAACLDLLGGAPRQKRT